VSEAQIPSAILGVNAVFEYLAGQSACEFRTGSSTRPNANDVAWADAIILVRAASPAERRILVEGQRLGRMVATYLDDDLESVPPAARSGAFYGSPVVRRNVSFMVRSADAVLVCSRRLGDELARRHGRAVTLLRQPRPPLDGSLDEGAGVLAESSIPGQVDETRKPLRIGFFGSVDHSSFVSNLLAGPLSRLAAEAPGKLKFVFCGAIPEFAERISAECHPYQFDYARWRRQAADLGVEIGLAPLPDTPFHNCKYFNKYLEYASLGIAGIYSRVPPYVDAVRPGVTGMLCENTPEDWYATLCELIEHRARRLAIARAAREDAEAEYSEAALRPDWFDALAPLLEHRAPAVEPRMVQLSGGALRFARDRLQVYGTRRFIVHLARRLRRIAGAS
jgi:glycosyltransferase involved in cell wall biosynthesis